MMQSYERSRTYDEDDFERASLLPPNRHHRADATTNGINDGGGGAPSSFRSRRRPRGGRQQQWGEEGESGSNDNEGVDDDDGGGRPRPAIAKIKSIARLGRAVVPPSSIDGDFDDGHDDGQGEDDGGEEEGGEYYFDDTNDHSRSCTFGTEEDDGIWLNRDDPPGTAMAVIVWILIGYSGVTVALLAEADRVSRPLACFHCTLCAMALASHAKTMLSDPGAVPLCAVPIDSAARRTGCEHRMCGACGGYKPPGSHHCRICNRCVSRMDHHCPWMNNCVGAGNLKSFVLFLCYAWVGSALSLVIFACNYFFCRDEGCEFEGVLVNLVRIMTVICVVSILFVSSMLANVTFGVMTGSGTIDRLKRGMTAAVEEPDDPPLQIQDIFGIGSWRTWFVPSDPIFPDHDRVLGYSMPQRLLREGGENSSIC